MPLPVAPNAPLAPVPPGMSQPTGMPVAPVVIQEDVTQTTPPADSGNVVGFKDLPPKLQGTIASAMSGDNLNAAKLMDQHSAESKDYHPNVQPQWGKVFSSLLSRNYGDAYKYFNGGATREEEGRTPTGEVVYKEYNEIGPTGVYKDRKTGKELSSEETSKLIARGGILTATDANALKTTNWSNAQKASTLANNGFASQLEAARTTAYAAANSASASNNNIEEQIKLAKSIPNVLNVIGQMDSDKRQKLLGYVNRYNTNSTNLQKSNEKGAAVNASGQQNVGIGGNVGFGGTEGTAGTGGKSALNAGASGNIGAANQAGVNQRETNAVNNTAGNTLQEQQNLQAAITQELQGAIKTPEQFRAFMRLQALNTENELALKQIPDSAKPPGYQNIPETDPFLGGAEAMISNRSRQQYNNALIAAWNAELFKAQRIAARTGEQADIKEVADKFQKSDMFKAITNTYTDKHEKHFGRSGSLKKGDLIVDQQHNIFQAQ